MKRQIQQGFALIEALIAVALLAIGLLGTVALQAKSYSALSDAGMRAEATIAAEQLIGVMTTDQANLANYAYASGTPSDQLAPWYNATRARIPNAVITVGITPDAADQRTKVDIKIQWQIKTGAQTNSHQVTSYIAGAL